MDETIEVDPEKLAGTPCFKGNAGSHRESI